jgi:NADPH2:quinone reductase
MKAVGYKKPSPIEDPDSLLDLDIPTPEPKGRDLLVEIKAVSVNPVDVKTRAGSKPQDTDYKILGYDAAGIVKQTGEACTLFKAGDEVFYAGSYARPGTNSEFHLVDERIVGKKPKTLDFAHAAANPLITITAWELLFDRFQVRIGKPANAGHLLIIGGSGSVGSILTQLASKLTGLTIIATASGSSPESIQRSLALGADHVIDHTKPLADQLKAIGIPQVELIAGLSATDKHYPALVEFLAPQGQFGLIDDPKTLDVVPLKRKSASLHWEFMFARSLFGTPDILAQHLLLNEASELIDSGVTQPTPIENLGTINAANLRKAHALVESGKAKSKAVLKGF